jgi:hypothetical protein
VIGIFIDVGAIEAAAVLYGSLSAVGVSDALPFVPADAERLTANVALLKPRLGPAAFARAVRTGATMTDGEIVSFVQGQIALLTQHETPLAQQ